MRCGCKTLVLIALILVDTAALVGAIINLIWNEAPAEKRWWLGWGLLAADALAVLLSIVVGVYHWKRMYAKSGKVAFVNVPMDDHDRDKDTWEDGVENGGNDLI